VTDDDQRGDGVDELSNEPTEGVELSKGSAEGKHRDPRVILDEMLDCVHLIQRYTQDVSFEEFAAQQMLRDAVVLRIAILGEAASHLSEDEKARWPTIPWRVITDMRNRLIHGYFAMRLDLIWQVVTGDLPLLERQLQSIRDTLP
jgi:uncharacterized protein with HEPN domain